MLNIGIIGAGTIAAVHASAVSRSGIARISKVHGRDERAGKLASEHGATTADSAAEILEDASIDAIIIATPSHTHAEYLRGAHAASKHILSEKPIVRTEEEAVEIERLFENYDKVAAVGHVLHFSPVYEHLNQTVKSGKLGQVGMIRFGRCCSFPRTASNWWGDFGQSGGVIMDLMIHDLDQLQHSFGPIERLYTARSAQQKDLHNDYALLAAKMKSGAIAHIEASWTEAPGNFYFYFEIAGSKGLLDYDSRNEPALSVTGKASASQDAPGVPIMSSPATLSPYDLQMRDFLECIQEGRQPRVTIADGIRAVRLAFAALQSAHENAPVYPD